MEATIPKSSKIGGLRTLVKSLSQLTNEKGSIILTQIGIKYDRQGNKCAPRNPGGGGSKATPA